mgnify:CR=1 FL=1
MATYFDKIGLSNMSNEEIILAINELNEEKKRREKIDRRHSVIALRDALKNFLDTGASEDFSRDIELVGGDVTVYLDDNKFFDDYDVDYVVFDVFNRDVLLHILNKLTECVGNNGG